MDENTVIKLHDHIRVLIDQGSNKELLVYNANEEKIFLKLSVANDESFSINELQHLLYHFHRIGYVIKSKYGKIVLSLYYKYPELFQTSTQDSIMLDVLSYELDEAIDFNHFFNTYEYSFERTRNKQIVLWGGTVPSAFIMNNIVNFNIETILIGSKEDKVEPLNMLAYDGETGEGKLNALLKRIPQTVQTYYLEDETYKSKLAKENAIHIICTNSFSDEQLAQITEQLEANKLNKLLYYGMYEKELVIGPLVIPDETARYTDFRRSYDGSKGTFTSITNHLSAGILTRIIYYLLVDSLKYLAEDAQLPLNAIFTINKYSLTGTAIKILKEGSG
ncbi:hypothetical protein K6959_01790 [Bacillus aquiflavi]|uniref:hypothetical protein n=1 Tax=Bacillus aquiflavi TaxID=2672567 RepID=UPI001CA946DD|nr:hypothetical protein [Bacillus aquiflavi]UAC48732.1 hypothetical protein K6959_01790 [Bacillus aquiflavi]